MDAQMVWVAEFLHPDNARDYYEQLDACGFYYSKYVDAWFTYEKPEFIIEGIKFVEYAEESVIPDENLVGVLVWVARGYTYSVRGVLARYGFIWSGKVWYRVGVDEPESIEGITFFRDIV